MAAPAPAPYSAAPCRKEKRKVMKKEKRKQVRQELAARAREEEKAKENDPEEREKALRREQEEAEEAETARREFEERERAWLEAAEARRRAREEAEEEERKRKLLEQSRRDEEAEKTAMNGDDDDGQWEYVDDGPAEIIWGEKEIIVKKKRVKVPKRDANRKLKMEDENRPTSNPLPPQSAAFAAVQSASAHSMQELLENAAQQTPNFGTEQDKAHCPFHLKTGACRFGIRCSRAHFYPDKSCTLLIKNMYNGPGLAWEQDEGLEFTEEEVDHAYEEFYEDVHTEFLKFGEIVNFKVCRNGSFHLRGNVYVHYKAMDSAVLAYNSMNGRYFAGKQIACEFVSIIRWKVAICGEFLKSRLKTCSHGNACNFLHCFRNPGGDYEWADWDHPPPRYWVKKMATLFGHFDDLESSKHFEFEDEGQSDYASKKEAAARKRHGRLSLRRSRDPDRDVQHPVSDEDCSDGYRHHRHSWSSRPENSSKKRSRNHFKCSTSYSNERYSSHRHGSKDNIREIDSHIDEKYDKNVSEDYDRVHKGHKRSSRRAQKNSFSDHERHDIIQYQDRYTAEDISPDSDHDGKYGVHKHHTRRSSSRRARDNSLSIHERHDIIQYQDRYTAEDEPPDSDRNEKYAAKLSGHNDHYLHKTTYSKTTVESRARYESHHIVAKTGSEISKSDKNGLVDFKDYGESHKDDCSRYTPIPGGKEDSNELEVKMGVNIDERISEDCIDVKEESTRSSQTEIRYYEKTKRNRCFMRSESEERSDGFDNQRLNKVGKHYSSKEKHDGPCTLAVKESIDPINHQSPSDNEHRKQPRSLISFDHSSSSSRLSS